MAKIAPINKPVARYLLDTYNRLYAYFGPQHWWPADSAFEVVVGAILTQNTSWANVEKAVLALKRKGLLRPKALHKARIAALARLIRPCGYYNLKARRLKRFLTVLFSDFKGSLAEMFSLPPALLRERLLAINGIGPETADSIMLYAAGKKAFVIDAYTRRFLARHKVIKQNLEYRRIQALFEENLPCRIRLFKEYHALIVRLGKQFCRSRPLCNLCPLRI